jgi:hypothetical protein
VLRKSPPNARSDTGKKGGRKMIISVRKVLLIVLLLALLVGGWVFWKNRNQTRFGLTPKEIEEIERRAEEVAPIIASQRHTLEPEKFAHILMPGRVEALKKAKEIFPEEVFLKREETLQRSRWEIGEPKLVEYEVLEYGQAARVEFPVVRLEEGEIVEEFTLVIFLGREKEGDEWLVGASTRLMKEE